MTGDLEREKQLAAEEAARLVEDGMTVGLGTGTTAAYFLVALAARNLTLRCVATSRATELAAHELGLTVERWDSSTAPSRLDVAVDGADQISPELWLVKGGGGAHTREKVVAAAAERFVVVASSNKLVDRLEAPVPLELLAYGVHSTLERLDHAELRDAPPTPDGGVLADWRGAVGDPSVLARFFDETPGVVEHGLFPPALVSEILVGRGEAVERVVPAA